MGTLTPAPNLPPSLRPGAAVSDKKNDKPKTDHGTDSATASHSGGRDSTGTAPSLQGLALGAPASASGPGAQARQLLSDARVALRAGDRNRATILVQQAKRLNPPPARPGED